VTNGATDASATKPDVASDYPLTPGEALEKLFLANADRGANAANDALVEELQRRIRAIQARADRRC
jgi:hypothetical protein